MENLQASRLHIQLALVKHHHHMAFVHAEKTRHVENRYFVSCTRGLIYVMNILEACSRDAEPYQS